MAQKHRQFQTDEPVVVMKKNNHKTLVVIDAEHFVKIHKDSNLSK